ncbi:GntR family transcriptional regulator [Paenibacillus methanolicus]|uniref:DNA-binding GntR family transcriptional regulator n=1 Tax=Paenibacillus methanolicus TaxID=582686 RepID=A0A5S5BYE4_9BACL|nr:GntR family transcriptional regulator [Paenibacillus methanolicus]TYP72044.1 DNA-binding GntR family transcriptional regulator [Paenibacillus methanolicus]
MSNADTAYAAIRGKLLHGEYMAETLLSENVLAEELQMSRTPVRDAILRLVNEGFLVSLRNRGILVRRIPIKEIYDYMQVLNLFQKHAIEAAVEQGLSFPIEELRRYLEEEKQGAANKDYYRYVVHSLRFTRCFMSVAGNEAMIKVVDSYHDRMIFVSITNYNRTPHTPHYSSIPLHEDILASLEASDYERTKHLFDDFLRKSKYRMFELGY